MEKRRKKTRVRRKNSGIKKLIFILVVLFIIIYLFAKVIIPSSVSLARYVYTAVRSYYLNSKEFYFNSDMLSTNNAHFESDNWSGGSEYKFTLNMSSKNNINEVSMVNIDYNVEYEYGIYKSDGTRYPDNTIEFYIQGMEYLEEGRNIISRTIYSTNNGGNNEDSFVFSVKPNSNTSMLESGDYVLIKIKATSTSPYVQEISGEFKIIVGKLGMSYKIEDQEHNPYCELIITNTLDYYIAEEPVTVIENIDGVTTTTTVAAGGSLTIKEYLSLTDADKAKCYSMKITLDFDPSVLRIDTTSGVYLVADKTTDVTYTTDEYPYKYVKQINFDMEAEESKVIKFYKLDASQNYTYPVGIENEESAIRVTPTYVELETT